MNCLISTTWVYTVYGSHYITLRLNEFFRRFVWQPSWIFGDNLVFFFHHGCYQFHNITQVLLGAQICSARHIESHYCVYYDRIWISKFRVVAILNFQHCDSCRHVIKDVTSFFWWSDPVLWLLYHKLLFFLMFRCAGCLAYYIELFSCDVVCLTFHRL